MNNIKNVAGYLYMKHNDKFYVYMHLRGKKLMYSYNIGAPGGQLEETDEEPLDGLLRELKEEAGIITSNKNWKLFLELNDTAMFCKDMTNKKIKFTNIEPSHRWEVASINKLKKLFMDNTAIIESKYNHAWIELDKLKLWLENNQKNVFYRPIQVLYYKLYISKKI